MKSFSHFATCTKLRLPLAALAMHRHLGAQCTAQNYLRLHRKQLIGCTNINAPNGEVAPIGCGSRCIRIKVHQSVTSGANERHKNVSDQSSYRLWPFVFFQNHKHSNWHGIIQQLRRCGRTPLDGTVSPFHFTRTHTESVSQH